MLSNKPLRTSVIGFGKIAAGYAEDPMMLEHFRYATHAQVLKDHPMFEWDSVVDFSAQAQSLAREQWRVPYIFANVVDLAQQRPPDVVVLATPPEVRIELLKQLPNVKAVLVEKPLGNSVAEAQLFLDYCRQHHIHVQVNMLRRADEALRKLANGYLRELVGKPQIIFGVYGNGLRNNGTHMVDLAEMLFGSIVKVQAMVEVPHYVEGPLLHDINIAFKLYFQDNFMAILHPLKFSCFRECGFDIWGEEGRLAIMQESLKTQYYPRTNNRAMSGAYEVASDKPLELSATIGDAFYHMYSNLADVVYGKANLLCSGEIAINATRIVEALHDSYRGGGKVISINE